jgi:hypothetical protein
MAVARQAGVVVEAGAISHLLHVSRSSRTASNQGSRFSQLSRNTCAPNSQLHRNTSVSVGISEMPTEPVDKGVEEV